MRVELWKPLQRKRYRDDVEKDLKETGERTEKELCQGKRNRGGFLKKEKVTRGSFICQLKKIITCDIITLHTFTLTIFLAVVLAVFFVGLIKCVVFTKITAKC